MAITNERISGGLKTVFDGTGLSFEFNAPDLISAVDFTTGTGVGTVELQVKMAGEFITLASVTADQVAALFGNSTALIFRWNCTAFTSGTITTYLQ